MNIRSPLDAGECGSDLGRRALCTGRLPDPRRLPISPPTRSIRSSPPLRSVQTAHPELFIGEFGDASVDKAARGVLHVRPQEGGPLLGPVTLIILLVVFGALVAAGIPLLLALTAVLATFGLWAISEPGLAERRVALRDGAPHRARRRRRLLDVLLEARARGARAGRSPEARSRSPRRPRDARCSSPGRP